MANGFGRMDLLKTRKPDEEDQGTQLPLVEASEEMGDIVLA